MPPQHIVVQPQVQNVVNVVNVQKKKLPLLIRLLYFCVIGSWLGTSWLLIALMVCATVVGFPVGVVMLALTPKIYFL
jgi:uncharacterized membrane protein YccF (DUF307 family)